jgi:hypothetical protein
MRTRTSLFFNPGGFFYIPVTEYHTNDPRQESGPDLPEHCALPV